MKDATSALDLVPTAEDIVSIATNVWSSINCVLEEAVQELCDAEITGSARVSIDGRWDGVVRLDLASGLPLELAAAMCMMEPADVTYVEVTDAIGELANMLGGNLKRLLPDPSRLSVPAVVLGSTVTWYASGAILLRAVDFTCGGRALRVTLWESSHAVAER